MTTTALLDNETLGRAAFQLLASSDRRRYLLEARRVAVSSGLAKRAGESASFREAVNSRITQLLGATSWQSLAGRSLEEIEAAVLLCALADSDSDHQVRVAVEQMLAMTPKWRLFWLRLIRFRSASRRLEREWDWGRST